MGSYAFFSTVYKPPVKKAFIDSPTLCYTVICWCIYTGAVQQDIFFSSLQYIETINKQVENTSARGTLQECNGTWNLSLEHRIQNTSAVD